MGEGISLLTSGMSPTYLLLIVLMQGYKIYQQYKKDNPTADPLKDLKDVVTGHAAANNSILAEIRNLLSGTSPTPAVAPVTPPGTVQTMVPVTLSFQPKLHGVDPPTS